MFVRKCSVPVVFLAVCLFPLSPAFADLLQYVSVSGSGSGSGNIAAPFGCPPPGTEVRLPFSFSGGRLQTDVGSYSFSQSGSASCNSVVASSSVNQSVVATAQSLMVTNVVSANVAGGAAVAASATASDVLAITFDLSQPALVNFTESLSNVCQGGPPPFYPPQPCPMYGPESADASASVGLNSGSIPLLPSFTLNPGFYTLTVLGSASAWTQVIAQGTSTLSLDAEFTAIPEPRWLAGLAVLLLIGVQIGRRSAAHS